MTLPVPPRGPGRDAGAREGEEDPPGPGLPAAPSPWGEAPAGAEELCAVLAALFGRLAAGPAPGEEDTRNGPGADAPDTARRVGSGEGDGPW